MNPEHRHFAPNWVSAPGETIADFLEERNLSRSDFADRIGWTTERTNDFFVGRERITDAVAQQLVMVLGASVGFWLNRDHQYLEDSARLVSERTKLGEDWLSNLPLSEMRRFGWLPDSHESDMEKCLRFFDVPDVKAWHQKYQNLERAVAFKTSPSFESDPGAVAAWLRRGQIEAASIDCKPWNPGVFESALLEIRPLSRKRDPDAFIPELRRLCGECGVAAVILRSPKRCRASGATRFLSAQKALLLLSFRYLSDDHLWFTFFHEAGHLLLHRKDALFLEGIDIDCEKEEKEANDFAARLLVPDEFRSEMLKLPVNGIEVVKFARRVGISPGIIVGQLQHYGRFSRRQLNNLKTRYAWAND